MSAFVYSLKSARYAGVALPISSINEFTAERSRVAVSTLPIRANARAKLERFNATSTRSLPSSRNNRVLWMSNGMAASIRPLSTM